MYRNWKKMAALGLAVLIGGMMPMSTMLAAEDNTEVVQEIEADSDSDAEVVSGAEVISDENESIADEVNADDENTVDEADAGEENISDEANADDKNFGDEVNIDDVIADDEVDPVNEQNVGIKVMSASDVAEAGDAEVQENTDAPVISIALNGEDCKVDGLGGAIDYKYTNVANSKFELSASLNGASITYRYFLDENPGDEAKDNDSITWSGLCGSVDEVLSSNKSYVVYVKAVKNGQTVYARSCGVVVDTTPPEIVGVEEGKTYPAGTTFTVSDANLDVVMVNETPVTPESDGSYRVVANGTSCMIRAKDKAGNERTCSITVSGGEETPGTGEETPGTGEETPGTGEETPETNTVISASGVYALKAGVKYHLAEGNWIIDGDRSVYPGGYDFYVKADGSYNFSK